MTKIPLVPDPRYSMDQQKSFEVYKNIQEDISMTSRKLYPREHQINKTSEQKSF
ncbi:TPA: hypothetical protein ACGZ92_002556 [Elizabethkingia anophelis]